MRPTVPTSSGWPRATRSTASTHSAARGERVAPQVHRHGAGVAGRAAQRDAQAREAVDRRHHADRQAFGLEHRPLLDVQLGVGEHVALLPRDLWNRLRIQAELDAALAPSVLPFGILRLEHLRDRTFRQPRGCRGAWCRSARLPRRRSRRPRSRTAVSCLRVRSTARIRWRPMTPSMPSYLPASRTVSRCEPSMRQGSPGRSPS